MNRQNKWLLACVISAVVTTTPRAQAPQQTPAPPEVKTSPGSRGTGLGSAAPVPIHDGFIRGADVRSFDDKGRARYAAGVIDGMLMAPVFGAPQENVAILENCVKSMNSTQLAGLLMKELNDHPDVQVSSAHRTLYRALIAHCAKK